MRDICGDAGDVPERGNVIEMAQSITERGNVIEMAQSITS